MWWIDPEKQSKLQQALADPSIKLEVEPVEDRYWIDFARSQSNSSSSMRQVQ
jgi:hypothetical protein